MTIDGGQLFQDGLMEGVPIVEVVEIHSAGVNGAVVGQAAVGQDGFAGGVVVNVAADRGIELVEGCLIELDARLLFDPGLELRVGGALARDELPHRVWFQPECVDHHRIITGADSRISLGEEAAGFEGDLEPEPGEVQDAEGPSDIGTDERDVCIAHRND
jgi:hypothetical protein